MLSVDVYLCFWWPCLPSWMWRLLSTTVPSVEDAATVKLWGLKMYSCQGQLIHFPNVLTTSDDSKGVLNALKRLPLRRCNSRSERHTAIRGTLQQSSKWVLSSGTSSKELKAICHEIAPINVLDEGRYWAIYTRVQGSRSRQEYLQSISHALFRLLTVFQANSVTRINLHFLSVYTRWMTYL